MKILVTGCRGQLGRELTALLDERLPGAAVYTDVDELDLTDAAAVDAFVERHEITHIVNCAAYTAVDRAEDDPATCLAVNCEAVGNLAKAAARQGARVVHISTDYVFDGTACRPYSETDKVNPVSQYGISKRKGETVLLALCPDAVVIRTAWLYSPHGNNFVKTMLRLGAEKSSIKVVADQIGTPTSATDLAEAVWAVLDAPQWMPGVYHFTDMGVASWYDFTKAIFERAGVTGCRVEPCTTADYPTAARRPSYSVLDKTKISRTFNLDIPHWTESLDKCLKRIVK